jgi:WD40 repeat protein
MQQTHGSYYNISSLSLGHDDVVTCMACDTGLDVVITGSADGTIIVHTLHKGKYVRSIVPDRNVGIDMRTSGHNKGEWLDYDAQSSDVSKSEFSNSTNKISNSQRISNSGSRAGSKGLSRVQWVGVTINGDIVTYSLEDFHLTVFSINGKQLVRKDANERLHSFLFSEDGQYEAEFI